MEFNVPDMSCGHCVGVITKTLTTLDASATVSVDLPTRKITVQTTQDRATVAAALADAGYPAN